MGMFDFLSGSGAGTSGGTGGFDFSTLFSNPNFYQALGKMGAGMSGKGTVGEAIGSTSADMIKQSQMQKAMQGLVDSLKVTPKGQAGPDAVTHKITADGTTTTIQSPSEANLNTYGTSVPPESKVGTGTSAAPTASTDNSQALNQSNSPFWRALLGQ
jgi:hypothetical protein